MIRTICAKCGWDSRDHRYTSRTTHLVDEHGLKRFEGMVRMYFISQRHVTHKHKENWVDYKAKRLWREMDVALGR